MNELEKIMDSIDVNNLSKEKLDNLIRYKNKKKNKNLVEKLKRHKEINDINLLSKYIICYFAWNKEDSVTDLSTMGIFLIANYTKKFEVEKIFLLVKKLIEINKLSKIELDFIEGKIELLWIFDYYKKEMTELKRFVLRYENTKEEDDCFYSSFKYDIMIYLNSLYFDLNFQENSNQKILNKTPNYIFQFNSEVLSVEELAEGCSLLYSIHKKTNSISNEKQMIFSRKKILSKDLSEAVIRASKLKRVQEWEAKHDFLKLGITKENNNYIINDDKNKAELLISLGAVGDTTKKILYFQNYVENFSMPKLEDFVKDLSEESIFEKRTDGIFSRYRILINLFHSTTEYLNKYGYLELNYELEFFCNEWNLDIQEFKTLQITEHVMLSEVIKFKILFQLVSKLVVQEYNKGLIPKEMILGLDCVNFKKKELIKLSSKFFDNSEIKAEEVINLLINKNDDYIDLIYTPFIEVDDTIYCFSSIIAHSNFVRNIIQQSYRNNNNYVTKRNGHDTLSLKCKDIFNESCLFKALDSVDVSYKKRKMEIDTVAFNEEVIILIECKNPLLATSSYEMRSTLQLMRKGEAQLKLLEEAFMEKSWKANFCKTNSIPNNSKQKIICLIVFGNRLISNNIYKEFPVRNINELDMLINRGKIDVSYSNGNNIVEKKSISIWQGEELSMSDFYKYISNENSIVNCKINSMEERYFTASDLRGKNLKYKTYEMNQAKMLNNIINYSKLNQ